MSKWEYRVFAVNFRMNQDYDACSAEIQAALNYAGSAGWEVFNVTDEGTHVRVYAKRPVKI